MTNLSLLENRFNLEINRESMVFYIVGTGVPDGPKKYVTPANYRVFAVIEPSRATVDRP